MKAPTHPYTTPVPTAWQSQDVPACPLQEAQCQRPASKRGILCLKFVAWRNERQSGKAYCPRRRQLKGNHTLCSTSPYEPGSAELQKLFRFHSRTQHTAI